MDTGKEKSPVTTAVDDGAKRAWIEQQEAAACEDDYVDIIDDEETGDEACAEKETEGSGRDRGTRKNWLSRRIAAGMEAMKQLQPGYGNPWRAERVPEQVWRELADRALGLEAVQSTASGIEELLAEAMEEERLIQEQPESERERLRRWFSSFHMFEDFLDSFECERDAWMEKQRTQWEEAYWRRAAAESFGRKRWTGPSGREGRRR